MHPIIGYPEKDTHRIIGLMSGTSADGIDAVLLEVQGHGQGVKVRSVGRDRGFLCAPMPEDVRAAVLRIAGGAPVRAEEICRLTFVLGELYADACVALCESAGADPGSVDLVGCHGQTVWHAPEEADFLGRRVRSTWQIGEASVIAERLGCPVYSDFRVRDVAAGGQGAPLVPFTDHLLYGDPERNVVLLNLGGIANVSLLPAGCGPERVTGFDTGPANMLLDALAERITEGRLHFDLDGRIAAKGRISPELLAFLADDEYLRRKPPKSTGREKYGPAYLVAMLRKGRELGLSETDVLATAARYTAECVRFGVQTLMEFRTDRLIVTGGGSRNPVIMAHLKELFAGTDVRTGEETGIDGDAKEAAAFALFANEAAYASCNTIPSVTGARHPVIMGKLSL